jgi:tetratricopeptide (TPR) repeat protein
MSATPLNPGASIVEQAVFQIRTLLQRQQFAEAESAASALLTTVPVNRDVLYLLAIAQRHQRRIPEALATLDRLAKAHPNFNHTHEERGHCYVALKDAPAAIQSYLKGVHANPALPASWSMLEGLYRLVGDQDNATTAAAHVAKLKNLPAEVVSATSLFSDGDLVSAEKMIRAFLLRNGDHIEAMRLLARIGLSLEVYDDAEILLEAVLQRSPDYVAARYDYARVLLERHKHAAALKELKTLLALDPEKREYLTLYATTVVGLGNHEEAIGIYQDLLIAADMPAWARAELHLSIAHSLKTLGRQNEAISAYRQAIATRPHYGEAYWSLANLKTYRFTDPEIADMAASESSNECTAIDRYHLSFALGKAHEDRQQFKQSYYFYERGNAEKRAESRYRPELIELNTRLQKELCTRDFFAKRSGFGIISQQPIFIVGLPRSGSTLLEQILASHSLVEGTQELANIPRIAADFQGTTADPDRPRYPAILADTNGEYFAQLGQKYLDDTRPYRVGKAFFIDKMPNNFRHIGLIHLMFPNARIIDARREPMACCFSNFKQLFARGQEFTYSLSDIARYYRTYLELMRHWDQALPGRILHIQHEDVVDHLEDTVRKILDFCGLEFEEACVSFHKTSRSVRTASSEQVRQPIFREGLDQWKHYEQWLGPLQDLLGDALTHYRD